MTNKTKYSIRMLPLKFIIFLTLQFVRLNKILSVIRCLKISTLEFLSWDFISTTVFSLLIGCIQKIIIRLYHVLRSAKKIVSYHINFVKGGILTSKEFDIVKILNKLLKKNYNFKFGNWTWFFFKQQNKIFCYFLY